MKLSLAPMYGSQLQALALTEEERIRASVLRRGFAELLEERREPVPLERDRLTIESSSTTMGTA